jgi:hypothetical protein
LKRKISLLILFAVVYCSVFAQGAQESPVQIEIGSTVQIGSWQDKDFTTEWQEKEWDFSSFFWARGKYTLTFTYTKGSHMLCMKDAVILADGVPVCEIADERTAGYNPRSFSFDFCVISRPESLVFKAQVRTDGGDNSYGTISLAYLSDEMIVDGVFYMSPSKKSATYKQYADVTDFFYIDFPAGFEEIGYSSFSGTSLKKVVVPGTVKLIDGWAFAHCQDLEEVIIEDGVQEIREGAFYDCPALVSVTLPASVVSIPKANALFGENKETRVFYCPEGSVSFEEAVQNGFQTVDSR